MREIEEAIVRLAGEFYDAHWNGDDTGPAFGRLCDAIEELEARRARYAHTRRPMPPNVERCTGRTGTGQRCSHRRERGPRADGKHCAHHRQRR
ncbi:MAG: hypothetical protein Q8S13_06095 [Dehalococcoidia bacterium]|nr:hypothetical protein [Dehalococcoidia bacterium]